MALAGALCVAPATSPGDTSQDINLVSAGVSPEVWRGGGLY